MKYYKRTKAGYTNVVFRKDNNGKCSMYFPSIVMGGKRLPGMWIDIAKSDFPETYVHEITEKEAFIEIL